MQRQRQRRHQRQRQRRRFSWATTTYSALFLLVAALIADTTTTTTRQHYFGVSAFSIPGRRQPPSSTTTTRPNTNKPIRVLVTGASGRTGQLVFETLLKDPRFDPKAAVRSERSAKKLRKAVPATRLDQIIVCDVTTLGDDDDEKSSNCTPPPDGLNQFAKIVICTSAVPVISKRSLCMALLKAPFNLLRRRKAIDFRTFRFGWQAGQYPELVDYQGQINQIHLAQERGAKQIVVVGSMGGTDPSNFLNNVGKKRDGSGNGDILLWKRRAERYLVESGLDYTILHPGGLNDRPGGEEDYVLDVDDKLMALDRRSISRADVASLCVAALTKCEGKKVALDCITQPSSAEENDDDDHGNGDSPRQRVRSAEEALQDFLEESKEYNYSL